MIKSYQILSLVVLSLAKLFTCIYLFWGQKCVKSGEMTRILTKCIDFFFLNKTNISHNLRYNYIEQSSSKRKLTRWH